ncbi:MAG: hypothetical protein C5B55_00490 [Blastocatellia bacterium]|nr:MAG: hypothetical protein C5B55_00490 [Blastocatellia bacterium]
MLSACRVTAQKLGWHVQETPTGFVCVEVQQNPFKSPVQLEVRVVGGTSNEETRIILRGMNAGMGPIQSTHVKAQVTRFMQELGKAAVASNTPLEPTQTANASQSKRSVKINSVRLTDDQIDVLEKAYRVSVQDGNYWYDPMTGGWGFAGGPTVGLMQAGLNIGGPLATNASNGNTGVFINGRNLPVQDLMLLQQVVATAIWPGRYWLDAQGNWGFEGGPVMGNIWAAAQQTGAPREGILSTYDKVGMVVIG